MILWMGIISDRGEARIFAGRCGRRNIEHKGDSQIKNCDGVMKKERWIE